MPTSREAGANDIGSGRRSFADAATWSLSQFPKANPLAYAAWNAAACCWQSSSPAEVTRDDFVAQAMMMLASKRADDGWSRLKAVQQLSVWGGPKPQSTLPNLWAERIKQAKWAGLLGKEGKKLNHQDNYWAFNRFYGHNSFLMPKDVGIWKRSSSTNAELHWLAEEACVQWAKAQPPELVAKAGGDFSSWVVLIREAQGAAAASPALQSLQSQQGTASEVKSTVKIKQEVDANAVVKPELQDHEATGGSAMAVEDVPFDVEDSFWAALDTAVAAKGKRVECWWHGDKCFFAGTVSRVELLPTGVRFYINYDDGDSKWHMLSEDWKNLRWEASTQKRDIKKLRMH